MKPENRKQVRLILELRREEAEKRIADAVKTLHADHAAKGCLRSGATIKRHGSIITVEGQNFIKDTLDEISDVSLEIDAYRMFCETFDIFTGNVSHAFIDNPVMQTIGRMTSIEAKPTLLLATLIGQLEKQKELRRFAFAAPFSGEGSPVVTPINETTKAAANAHQKNNGGRPPAEFWDSLWAAMAGQLYKGEIDPKSQADIENAMLQWLENNDHSAAVSTVRKRARLLWQSIESE